MIDPRWLTRAVVVALHDESLTLSGGLVGIRDEGLLDSALALPRNLLAYPSETGIESLAAAYGFGLVRSHPFLDGNKRVAVVAVAVFLAINGLRFDPDEADEVRTILSLAAGHLDEQAFAAWVSQNTAGGDSKG